MRKKLVQVYYDLIWDLDFYLKKMCRQPNHIEYNNLSSLKIYRSYMPYLLYNPKMLKEIGKPDRLIKNRNNKWCQCINLYLLDRKAR